MIPSVKNYKRGVSKLAYMEPEPLCVGVGARLVVCIGISVLFVGLGGNELVKTVSVVVAG